MYGQNSVAAGICGNQNAHWFGIGGVYSGNAVDGGNR